MMSYGNSRSVIAGFGWAGCAVVNRPSADPGALA